MSRLLLLALLAAAALGLTRSVQADETTLTGEQVFSQAWRIWSAAAQPPFESFTLPCHEPVRGVSCGSSTAMRVTLRLSDGEARIVTVPASNEPARVLMSEGVLYGPAYAPLGFVKRLGGSPARVGSLASDPFGGIATIATVTAINPAYTITMTAEDCEGRPCYHLALVPKGDAHAHPLRDLWVDGSTFAVVRLRYGMRYHGAEAAVTYMFASVPGSKAPTIVRIAARVPERRLLGIYFVDSDESLSDIAFSQSAEGL